MDARWASWWVLALSMTAASTAAGQLRPERCEDVRRGDGYVVVFHEAAARFDMPSRPALENEELILCIESADRWNRYRLTFGRSQQGTTSVGFAPTQALTTALRREHDDVDATLDAILKTGAEKARGIANETLQNVYTKMGIAFTGAFRLSHPLANRFDWFVKPGFTINPNAIGLMQKHVHQLSLGFGLQYRF